jgi:hypothetical protein
LGLRSIGSIPLRTLGFSLSACRAALDDPQARENAREQLVGANDRSLLMSGAALDKSVVIIGSGYGSAVTALRLTERGIPVTMLEMGRLWNKPQADGRVFCSPLAPDGRAMWFQDPGRACGQSRADDHRARGAQRRAHLEGRLHVTWSVARRSERRQPVDQS